MSQPEPLPGTEPKRPLRKRWWFRTILLLLLLVTAFALSLPFGLRYGLRHWLLANGADQVEIGGVRINPFTVSLSLRDITIVRDGAAVLDKARIDLNIGLSRVIKHQAYIQSVEFHHLNLDLHQDADGRLRIASYTLPPDRESPAAETDATGTPWIFRADRVRIIDSLIHFTRPNLDLSLAIDRATLVRFTTEPGDKSGAFSFTGRLNDAPVTLKLDTLRVLPDLVFQGSVKAEQLRCDWLDRMLAPWLDPFTGSLDVDGGLGFASLSSGVMQVEYDGRLELRDGDIGGQAWKTAGRSLAWQGKVTFRDVPEQAMTVTTDGSLHGTSLRLDLPGQQLVLQEPDLELRGRTTVTIAGTVRVKSDASLVGKGSRLELPPYTYSDNGFHWQGTTFYDSGSADAGLKVRTDGSLRVHGTVFTDQADDLPLAAGGTELSWQGKIGFLGGPGAPRIDLAGTLAGREMAVRLRDRFRLDQKTLQLTAHGSLQTGDQLALAGTASLQAAAFRFFQPSDKDAPTLALGSLRIDDLAAPGGREITVPLLRALDLEVNVRSDLPLHVTVPEIRLADIRTTDLATVSARLLQVQTPRVRSLVNDHELVRLGSVELKNLQADTDGSVAVHRLSFDDLRFLDRGEKNGPPICRVGGATLAGIRWSPDEGVSGDSLGFDDLYCTLVRRKDGSLDAGELLGAMRRPGATTGQADRAQAGTGTHTAIRLGSVIVRGRSGLHFEDHTLAVPFISDLAIETLQVTGIDSGHPDRPARVRMAGTLENRAPLRVTGTVQPFADPLALAMKIKLKNYPLKRLSAYTVQSVGTALAAGRLKLKTSLTIADGRLDMQNHVVLKKLETRTISPELAKKLDNRLPVPLDSALSLLRDSKGDISLDVPLEGPLSDLNVGIGDILITALGKAIVPAASSYLVYALGPYAALAYVGVKVGEKMLEVSLPPVEFAPGSAGIDEKQKKYLERIATLLRDRPQTDLQLMPICTPRDLAPAAKTAPPPPPRGSEQEKALLGLGQQRAEALRDYLATTWSIDRNRLMISMTRIATGEKQSPRVELQL